MLLKGIDHITINIKDIEKSVEFYKNIFNLPKLDSVDMGDHILTFLGLPNGCRLELIEYMDKHRDILTEETDGGIFRHVAFSVASLGAVYKRCIEYNVRIKLQPVFVDKLNCWAMLIEDPNGVELEIVEKTGSVIL